MKRILFLLFLPAFGFAQTVQDTLDVPRAYYDSISPKNYKATWPTRAEHSALIATVNTINGVQTLQGQSIKDLQTQVAGIVIPSVPLPKQFYGDAYTLTETDNNGVIYCYATCTVTCPTLFAGFKCKIVRMGASSSVTINGANSVYGFKRLTLQYADGDINYITNSQPILTGRISK